MSEVLDSLLTGLVAPVKGLELIFRNPRVRHSAILPFAIVLITFLLGIFFGLPVLFKLIPWLANKTIATAGLTAASVAAKFFYYGLIAMAVPVGVFALLFAVYLASQLLAAPFYALLAERALAESGVLGQRPFRFKAWLKVSLRLLLVAWLKTMLFGVVGGLLFVLSFIPGLGLFSAYGFLLMAAYDIVDISMDAMHFRFGERILFFKRHFPAFFGLATTLGLVFFIPGLNFLLFPASIAGAHVIFARAKVHHVENLN